MKTFITGINGFIGSNLARFLLKKGCEVSGSVRTFSDLSFIKNLPITLFTGDIRDDQFLGSCFQKQDVIFHVAALASDWGAWEKFYQTNVRGTQYVAQAAFKNRAHRLIFVSSAAVYGFSGYQYANETFPKPARNFNYARSKRIAEKWLRTFQQKTGLPITIIQPTNVYGPCDRTFFIKFAQALERGLIPFINHGRALTCPLYVENLTNALWLAATNNNAVGETFLISDGLYITWQQYISNICEALNINTPHFSLDFEFAYALASFVEGIYQFFQLQSIPPITRYRVCNFGIDYHFSIEKAKSMLGYEPTVGIKQAIKKTVHWYQEF